jgi:hypothetical protein
VLYLYCTTRRDTGTGTAYPRGNIPHVKPTHFSTVNAKVLLGLLCIMKFVRSFFVNPKKYHLTSECSCSHINQHQPTLININKHQQTSTNINQHQQTSSNIIQHQATSTTIHYCTRIGIYLHR